MTYREILVKESQKRLLDAVKENDFKSIKFVLENLDPNFSLETKDLLYSIYSKLFKEISETQAISNTGKTLVLEIIKKTFDNV